MENVSAKLVATSKGGFHVLRSRVRGDSYARFWSRVAPVTGRLRLTDLADVVMTQLKQSERTSPKNRSMFWMQTAVDVLTK